MNAEDWADPEHAAIAFRLDGDGMVVGEVAEGVLPGRDDSFLVLMNGETHGSLTFVLPGLRLGDAWRVVVDTREPATIGEMLHAGDATELPGGSLVVLVGVGVSTNDPTVGIGTVSAETSTKQTVG
jgi:pullulanase/glycogen debranching enzyme